MGVGLWPDVSLLEMAAEKVTPPGLTSPEATGIGLRGWSIRGGGARGRNSRSRSGGRGRWPVASLRDSGVSPTGRYAGARGPGDVNQVRQGMTRCLTQVLRGPAADDMAAAELGRGLRKLRAGGLGPRVFFVWSAVVGARHRGGESRMAAAAVRGPDRAWPGRVGGTSCDLILCGRGAESGSRLRPRRDTTIRHAQGACVRGAKFSHLVPAGQ